MLQNEEKKTAQTEVRRLQIQKLIDLIVSQKIQALSSKTMEINIIMDIPRT